MWLSKLFLYCCCARNATTEAPVRNSSSPSNNAFRNFFDGIDASAREEMWDDRVSLDTVGSSLVKVMLNDVVFVVLCV